MKTNFKKSINSITCLVIAILSFAVASTCQAQSAKDKAKCAYVIKNIKLDKAKHGQFATTFYAYLKERKQARAVYEDMKDKLKEKIKAGSIDETQAQQLLDNRWAADEKEVQIRKKYTPLFVKIIGAKNTYNVFKFANDKIK